MNSPDALQVWLNDRYRGAGTESAPTPLPPFPFIRVLTDDMPRVPYRRRTDEVKTVIHWGQRKLLMSEIEFLTQFGRPGMMVVYAGAAPGTHLGYLSAMFPDLSFLCVDPAPFTVHATDRISTVQDLFTDDMALQLRARYEGRLLFVSDIRTADFERDTDAQIEEKVRRDMDMQQRWHMIMRPVRSMLKFRLPWQAGTTRYLSGRVCLPVWGPITTTETRLITDENSISLVDYDHKAYEERLFYFNTVARPALYPHCVAGGREDAEGIDHCYDCTAEVHILSQYLTEIRRVPEEQLPGRVARLSREVSRQISHNRTLKDPNPDPADRVRRIRRNQWIDGRPAYEVAAVQPHTRRVRLVAERGKRNGN